MNQANETVITPQMREELRKMGLADGYEEVPSELEEKAKALLGHNPLADMDEDMKRRLRNRNKRLKRIGVAGY